MSGRLRCANGKAVPVQVCYRPTGFWEVEVPRFRDDQHITVRLSALLTGRLYSSGNIPGTQRVSRSQGQRISLCSAAMCFHV
jgi:hypothetical protein